MNDYSMFVVHTHISKCMLKPQKQLPAGTYFSIVGTNNLKDCIIYCKYGIFIYKSILKFTQTTLIDSFCLLL